MTESDHKVCLKCNGHGIIQIAPNVRGVKKCDKCLGKGHLDKDLHTKYPHSEK